MIAGPNIIAAFDEDSVVRLTRLSKAQLRYWDKIGFFKPTFAHDDRSARFSRLYSFTDVAGLRTIGTLVKDYRVPLQHLRRVAEQLSHLEKSLWTSQKLYVFNKEVYFDEPETGKQRGVVSKQFACLELRSIVEDIEFEAKKLRERPNESIGKIERKKNVAQSEPVIAGTRIRVDTILNFHEEGYSVDEILQEYPSLTKSDVEAAIRHGRKAA